MRDLGGIHGKGRVSIVDSRATEAVGIAANLPGLGAGNVCRPQSLKKTIAAKTCGYVDN